ncbi:hypothetical protein [Porphyromonas gingivalis]|nr:hypothetical protein [Porphyromonas gingivalis]
MIPPPHYLFRSEWKQIGKEDMLHAPSAGISSFLFQLLLLMKQRPPSV